MAEDTGRDMKDRLRADLRVAMKDGRGIEVKLIRALVAAIDNAEAPPVSGHIDGAAAEAERLLLDGSRVRDVLLAEIEERERAAAAFDRLEKTDHAKTLRTEALLARRYLD